MDELMKAYYKNNSSSSSSSSSSNNNNNFVYIQLKLKEQTVAPYNAEIYN
jgi:hypothetical protein